MLVDTLKSGDNADFDLPAVSMATAIDSSRPRRKRSFPSRRHTGCTPPSFDTMNRPARLRKRLHVDLRLAGFIRLKREPSTVGREGGIQFRELRLHHRKRFAIAEERKRPQIPRESCPGLCI